VHCALANYLVSAALKSAFTGGEGVGTLHMLTYYIFSLLLPFHIVFLLSTIMINNIIYDCCGDVRASGREKNANTDRAGNFKRDAHNMGMSTEKRAEDDEIRRE
jgi:hypothetical protein